jgi:hypothetical protein
MLTIVETAKFQELVDLYLDEESFTEFKNQLANHPDAGDVIPGSGGVRKIRWSRAGMGKRGGVRVIYFARLTLGEIVLLTIYAKAKFDSIPPNVARALKEAYESS